MRGAGFSRRTIMAGQAGPWHRDLPITYLGQTTFLEMVLEVLRTAEKIT